MDRLVKISDVEAALDARIDTLNCLLENRLCKGHDRVTVGAQIGALAKFRNELAAVPSAEVAA